jgi:hypothetical protein
MAGDLLNWLERHPQSDWPPLSVSEQTAMKVQDALIEALLVEEDSAAEAPSPNQAASWRLPLEVAASLLTQVPSQETSESIASCTGNAEPLAEVLLPNDRVLPGAKLPATEGPQPHRAASWGLTPSQVRRIITEIFVFIIIAILAWYRNNILNLSKVRPETNAPPAASSTHPERERDKVQRQPAAKSNLPILRTATQVVGHGTWIVENGELVLYNAAGEEWLVFGDGEWEDYDFSFDVLQEGIPSGIAALFRSPDETKSQQFGFGWLDFKTCIMNYAEEGNLFASPSPLRKGLQQPVQPFRWYRVRFVVRGKTTKAYLDDQLIFKLNDNRFDAGRVGMRAFRRWIGKTRFRNIRVTAEDGTILWEGPPKIDTLRGADRR